VKNIKYTISKKDGALVSSEAQVAGSFLLRLMGLMGKKSMPAKGALIFYKAPSIHTFFMRFAFDLVFLDKNGKIMRLCPAIKPWRLVFCPSSHTTIEFSPGTIGRSSLKIGDLLIIRPLSI
jgi:uncharacterized protein